MQNNVICVFYFSKFKEHFIHVIKRDQKPLKKDYWHAITLFDIKICRFCLCLKKSYT